jgi:hypothetical protein
MCKNDKVPTVFEAESFFEVLFSEKYMLKTAEKAFVFAPKVRAFFTEYLIHKI